jgi:hypothetical protein
MIIAYDSYKPPFGLIHVLMDETGLTTPVHITAI